MFSIRNATKLVALTIAIVAVGQTATAQSENKKADSSPLKEGDNAVDFELQGLGKKVKLSDNFGDDGNNVVVVFSRANW